MMIFGLAILIVCAFWWMSSNNKCSRSHMHKQHAPNYANEYDPEYFASGAVVGTNQRRGTGTKSYGRIHAAIPMFQGHVNDTNSTGIAASDGSH